jgi:hypothetical protein
MLKKLLFFKLKNFPLNDNILTQGNFFLKVPQLKKDEKSPKFLFFFSIISSFFKF